MGDSHVGCLGRAAWAMDVPFKGGPFHNGAGWMRG